MKENIDPNFQTQSHMEKAVAYFVEKTTSEGGSGIISLMNPAFFHCNALEKTLTIRYYVEDWELNPQGSMHGGLIAAAFDNTFGLLTHYFAKGNFITTVELSTKYLKPIPKGCHILIKAKICSIGRTISSLSGEAYIEETDTLASTSSSTFMILRNKSSQLS